MILVGGGARSGKSSAALRMLRSFGPRQGFIATAQAFDDEMRDRIFRHKVERGAGTITFEEPLAVAELITAVHRDYDAIVVDCLTLWLTNLLLSSASQLNSYYDDLISASLQSSAVVILVTNEVGTGIVPENALARTFRDEQGRLNQMAAQHAAEVYFMTFGLSARLK